MSDIYGEFDDSDEYEVRQICSAKLRCSAGGSFSFHAINDPMVAIDGHGGRLLYPSM